MEVVWIAKKLLLFLLLLISLTIREWARAFVADKLGDPTPRQEGRLSLNPLVHIDLFGTILFPLICVFCSFGLLFGWGRPITVYGSNFKRPEFDTALVGFSGIFGNLLLCFIASVVLGTCSTCGSMAYALLELNAVLIAINLVPLPGLDSFFFVKNIFKLSNDIVCFLERWGIFILLILINIPGFRWLIVGTVNGIVNVFLRVTAACYGIKA